MTQVIPNTQIQNSHTNNENNTSNIINSINNDKSIENNKLSWRNRNFYQCK